MGSVAGLLAVPAPASLTARTMKVYPGAAGRSEISQRVWSASAVHEPSGSPVTT